MKSCSSAGSTSVTSPSRILTSTSYRRLTSNLFDKGWVSYDFIPVFQAIDPNLGDAIILHHGDAKRCCLLSQLRRNMNLPGGLLAKLASGYGPKFRHT